MIIGSSWLILVLSAVLILNSTPVTTQTIALAVLITLTQHWWGPLLFLSAYIIRPLVWLPISVFSVISGAVFGVWPGILLTMLGTIISGIVAYFVGRYFASALPDFPISKRMTAHRKYPFEFIASLHFSFLPFDVINYAAGLARIPFLPFLFGVIIGMIPGTFTLTMLGASVDISDIVENGITTQAFNWTYFTIAAVGIILIWASSYMYRRNLRTHRRD